MYTRAPVVLLWFVSLYPGLSFPAMAASPENTHITATELNTLIVTGQAPTIIDVRSGREYAAGHVPGAIHLPFWLSFARADELAAPKDRLVVIYCEHGPRAAIGKYALTREGFTRIRYLQGHMGGWRKAGYPQETPSRRSD
jgi:hydroxyacylglutathione hydrolase